MELALGTVQFGLAYGVAGAAAPVPEAEALAILRRAAALGIRTLDTAPAYGDIEERLAGLAGDADLRIVTKLPALPAGIAAPQVAGFIAESLARSIGRLGDRITGILFHHAADLLSSHGAIAWEAAARVAGPRNARLGASCYDVETLAALQTRYPVDLAQLPGNAFDQGLRRWSPGAAPPQVHIRSAFLQGLLLLPQAEAAARVPRAAGALRRWHAWCGERGLSPLAAALSIAKSLPGASHCIVGVDRLDQLEAIAAAWSDTHALPAPELATLDADVIDPRRWPARAA